MQADDKLNGLYATEQDQLNKLANWRQDVQAEDDGIVSFYMDGWETQLTPYNLDTLTRADILAAKKALSAAKLLMTAPPDRYIGLSIIISGTA